ncbi:MAG: EamA family transporter, partial [Pseudonocardia sp.]|nr:EamA family transporter [Pseudonocardia sp.]
MTVLATHSPAHSVSTAIVLAVLAAALLHAAWNSLAHGMPDRLVGFALIGVADTVGGGIMVALAGPPPAQAWPYILGSALTHVIYNALLLTSYQLGEFSQMYP